MNSNALKIIRHKSSILTVFFILLIIAVVVQTLYSSYLLSERVTMKRGVYANIESRESFINIPEHVLPNLQDFANKNFYTIDFLDDNFSFLSAIPICNDNNIQIMLKTFGRAIHNCLSYQMANGKWLNIIDFYVFQVLRVITLAYFLITIICILMCLMLIIRIKWSIPFMGLQRFAHSIGLVLPNKPFRGRYGGVMARNAAETFQFMQDRVSNMLAYQNRLLAMVCHDIRTPLAKIQSRRVGSFDEWAEKDLYNIQEINQILDNMVDFSKENWLDGIAFKQINIVELLDECVVSYQDMGKKIVLQNELMQPQMLNIKLSAFKRAVTNIINNGLKYSAEVTIRVRKSDVKTLTILIVDNGEGISESIKQEVFKPFYSQNKTKKSSGLGLYIAKEVIKAHQGEIDIYNLDEGGCCVRIDL